MAGEGSYPFPIHPASSNRWVVPSVGVEPTRPCGHLILSQARLPVSPRGILFKNQYITLFLGASVMRMNGSTFVLADHCSLWQHLLVLTVNSSLRIRQ